MAIAASCREGGGVGKLHSMRKSTWSIVAGARPYGSMQWYQSRKWVGIWWPPLALNPPPSKCNPLHLPPHHLHLPLCPCPITSLLCPPHSALPHPILAPLPIYLPWWFLQDLLMHVGKALTVPLVLQQHDLHVLPECSLNCYKAVGAGSASRFCQQSSPVELGWMESILMRAVYNLEPQFVSCSNSFHYWWKYKSEV